MSRWVKFRKEISPYPETEQQRKIRVAGKLIGQKCTGKKDVAFRQCRREVLDCVFKGKCDGVEELEVEENKAEA